MREKVRLENMTMKPMNKDRKILAESGLPIISAENMGEAAQRIVTASRRMN